MSQNVNLFNPAFRKQERVLTLKALVACLAVTLLVLVAIEFYLYERAKGYGEELASAEGLLARQRSYSARLTQENAQRKRDARLDADITRLETELKQAQEAMEALKGGVLGTQEGFAEYLRAFSRQSLNGLWLTGLSISGSGDIEIRGRVLSAELVPGYIQRLNREKVLAGRSFGRLEMARPRPEAPREAEKGKDKSKDVRPDIRSPRFLEFSLATADGSKGEKPR